MPTGRKPKPVVAFVDDGQGGKHFVAINPKHARDVTRADRYNLIITEWVTAGSLVEAATRAGYSSHANNACVKLKKRFPEIIDEVRRRRAILAKKVELNQESVIIELARIGFANIGKIITWVDGKPTIADSDLIDEDTMAAVQEIGVDKDGAMKLKMYDKKGALVDLGKFLGMAQPADVAQLLARVAGEDTTTQKAPLMDKRELARRAALLLKQGKLAALR